ncbi:MAG TPA: LPD38 domain-containing protein, partial [Candidatus Saccharimonadia bacterium]|nr:LPD38 domain-containing protein [Candidatus Saccharimonadia bacterium]
GFGEFLGSTLPISKLYNVLGKPLVTLASKSPVMAKSLQSLARMTGFGLTGATYEGAKEKVKTGEIPSAEELAKYGIQWAAFDGALQVLGKAVSFLPKLKGYAEANKISEKEALNQVIENLANEGVNAAENPEMAVIRAEEIIDGITGKDKPRETTAPQVEGIASGNSESAQITAKVSPLSIQQTTKTALPEKIEPIIETTGKGADERIEYPKTGMDKLIDTTNEFIKAARSPSESLKRLGQKANENIFNAIAPLERLEQEIPISERVSTRIKFSQSAASEINSVLENGIFSNITGNFEHQGLKGAYGDLTWKKLSKGLKEGEFSLQDLDVYRTSKIALRRQAEGKKVGIDTNKAKADIARLAKNYAPIDKNIRDFQKATLQHYGKDLLGEDLIAQWNKNYYSPLYRVMESGKDSILKPGALTPKQPFKRMKGSERKIVPPSESDPYNASMLISNSRKNDSILQYRKLVLEGKLPGKFRGAKNDPIPSEVLEDLDIDSGLKNVAESLYNQTRKEAFTPEKNVLRGWKDGKPFKIEVPEDIYNVFSSIAPQDHGPLAKIFGATNRLFSRGISMAPRKFGSIFGRDALSSLVYSRTGSNPISIAEALSDIYNAKPIYKEFLSMGGDVYASRLAERIDRARKVEDLISPGKEGILVPFAKMGDYFRKYGETLGDISLAVPLGEYKRALAKFGNTAEGRIMAAMEARRVTYDPTRKGGSKIVRELGNYIPFWNVSLQDMAMLGSNLKSPTTWAKGMAAITIPTLLLKMTNEGNPDYEDLTPVDKAAFWHMYFGDKHIRIPIPWLLGTAFKVGAEGFYDTVQELRSKGNPNAKDAWKGLYENFVENLSGDLPPILSNYIEMSTGKSVPSPLGLLLGTESRAPEVVPKRLQDLPSSLQYTSKTSQLARKFGQLWNVSPVKLERTIKNFGTQVASDIFALTDEIAYATGLAEDKRPEQRESNYLLLGNFVSNSPPARTKYANEFYEYLREATQNKNAQKVIFEKGITDASLDSISYSDVPIFAYNRSISKLFKAMRTVEDDSSLNGPQKKKELDYLQREINSLYKQVVLEIRITKF